MFNVAKDLCLLQGTNRDSRFQTMSVFKQTGGYRVGLNGFFSINASWPFGSLEVQPDQLVLRCLTCSYVFPAASITRVSFHQGFFSSGLRIEHSIPDYPAFILFWSSDMKELGRKLTQAGFQVEDLEFY